MLTYIFSNLKQVAISEWLSQMEPEGEKQIVSPRKCPP